MKKSYWENCGLYQKDVKKIEKVLPIYGMTENKYLNLFIIASNVYYDVHNNGGENIEECFMDNIIKYTEPFQDSIKTINFKRSTFIILDKLTNLEKLEKFMNEVVRFVRDKDLNYKKYYVWINYDEKVISKTKFNNSSCLVFGDKKCYDAWINRKLNTNYSLKLRVDDWLWHCEDIQNDIKLLQKMYHDLGYDLTKEQCYEIWYTHSEECSANWISIDKSTNLEDTIRFGIVDKFKQI